MFRHTISIIILMLLCTTALMVGGYVLHTRTITDWEHKYQELATTQKATAETVTSLDIKITALQNTLDELEKSPSDEEVTPATPTLSSTDPLCTAEATTNEIGREIYPIDTQYAHLPFLGQLFTAYACGPARMTTLPGMENGKYTLGSLLLLNEAPSGELRNTLKRVGYSCETGNDENKCTQWKLENPVSPEALMKLEPYAPAFKQDDCRNCG